MGLEGTEKRLRLIEVPIEVDNSRYEKLEANLAATKFPIKDLYQKFEVIDKAQGEDKETHNKLMTTLEQRFEKFKIMISAEEEKRIAT